MDQIPAQTFKCNQHQQTISLIHLNPNSNDVLKCLRCLISQNLPNESIIPIESIVNLKPNHILENWTFSNDQIISQAYQSFHKSIDVYDKNRENLLKYQKQQMQLIYQKLDDYCSIQVKQIDNIKDLKQSFQDQFKKKTCLGELENIFKSSDLFSVNDLNSKVKSVINKSLQQQSEAKQYLQSLACKIGSFNFDFLKKQSENLFNNIIQQIDNQLQQSSNPTLRPQFQFQQQNQNPINQKFQNYQIDQKLSQINAQNIQNKIPSKKVLEIVKLIGNKSNGCKDQFLQDIQRRFVDIQDQLENINMQGIFQDENIYPLKFDKLSQGQFNDLSKYLNQPEGYKLIEAIDDKNQQQLQQFNKKQVIFEFENTNFQQSQKIKISQKNNSIEINNTNKNFIGQVITNKPLQFHNNYLFRISFNKPFVGNFIYFGLISSKLKDLESLTQQNRGFTFSQAQVTQPQLLFGKNFLHRSHENVQLEVRICLQKKQILIFSYPDFQSGMVQTLIPIDATESYYFGVEFNTENNFIVTIFDQEIIE